MDVGLGSVAQSRLEDAPATALIIAPESSVDAVATFKPYNQHFV